MRGERRSLTISLKAATCSSLSAEGQAAVDGAAQIVVEAVAVQAPAPAEACADELQFELEKKEFSVNEALLHSVDHGPIQGLGLVDGAQGRRSSGKMMPAPDQVGKVFFLIPPGSEQGGDDRAQLSGLQRSQGPVAGENAPWSVFRHQQRIDHLPLALAFLDAAVHVGRFQTPQAFQKVWLVEKNQGDRPAGDLTPGSEQRGSFSEIAAHPGAAGAEGIKAFPARQRGFLDFREIKVGLGEMQQQVPGRRHAAPAQDGGESGTDPLELFNRGVRGDGQ